MMKKFNHFVRFYLQNVLIILTILGLQACEAPLVLEGVENQQKLSMLRFDRFQSIAENNGKIVVVGAHGAVLISADNGESWTRKTLSGKPSLTNISNCGENRFAALDMARQIWISENGGESWEARKVETQEELLTLTCTSENTIWIGGSFSTLLSSSDFGESWSEKSLEEDLMFTAIQFFDKDNGIALGEFGSVVTTSDGGKTWETQPIMPNDLYPQSALFTSPEKGWVTGLNGIILHTDDSAQTWVKQKTPTNAPLYGIAASDNAVYVVGDNGTVLKKQNGSDWQLVEKKTETLGYLRAVAVLESGDVAMAGGGGVVSLIAENIEQVSLVKRVGE